MHRKYVRKWWLLKRNRIICPEVAVNGQFLPGKSTLLVKLPEKPKCFVNLPGKIKILLTRIHDPQISNQIDATATWVARNLFVETLLWS